jgi:hypothetical protein
LAHHRWWWFNSNNTTKQQEGEKIEWMQKWIANYFLSLLTHRAWRCHLDIQIGEERRKDHAIVC